MDYKKKFEDFLDKMQGLLDSAKKQGHIIVRVEDIENTFPELKESEDERIRTAILNHLKKMWGNCKDDICGVHVEDAIAWLEKQGGQKINIPKWKYKKDDMPLLKDSIILNKYGCVVKSPSGAMVSDAWVLDYDELTKLPKEEKVKPKFHEGDWIVDNNNGGVYQVTEIRDDEYCLCHLYAEMMGYFRITDVDNDYRLWTIQDAKDGDVLAAHECYVIFKEIDGLNIKCYCTYHYMGFNPSFHVDTLQNKDAFQPATKEQRDTLMKAITDAGYTFDFEKKELKKIEFNPNDLIEESYQQQADDLIDMVTEKPADKVEPKDYNSIDPYFAKPIDKVEPHNSYKFDLNFDFSVGQWIVACGKKPFLITKIDGFNITLVDTNGDEYVFDVSSLKDARLWTIENAKDGDVLAFSFASINYILIYKGLYEKNFGTMMSVFCFYIVDENVYHDETDSFHVMNGEEIITPATKEQRDKLLKAMADEGWTFDFENKELKKIEDESEDCKQQIMPEMADIENGTHYYTDGIPIEPEYVEYVCTDAFIEKALEWIKENIRPYYHEVRYKYEDFKKYMKGGKE